MNDDDEEEMVDPFEDDSLADDDDDGKGGDDSADEDFDEKDDEIDIDDEDEEIRPRDGQRDNDIDGYRDQDSGPAAAPPVKGLDGDDEDDDDEEGESDFDKEIAAATGGETIEIADDSDSDVGDFIDIIGKKGAEVANPSAEGGNAGIEMANPSTNNGTVANNINDPISIDDDDADGLDEDHGKVRDSRAGKSIQNIDGSTKQNYSPDVGIGKDDGGKNGDDDDNDDEVQILTPQQVEIELRRKRRKRLYRLLEKPGVIPSFLAVLTNPHPEEEEVLQDGKDKKDDDSSVIPPPIVVIDVDEYLGLKEKSADAIPSSIGANIASSNSTVTPTVAASGAAATTPTPSSNAAADEGWYEGSKTMAMPEDATYLSDMQQWIRRQLEYFSAADIDVKISQSGRRTPTVYGKVGYRCIHCAKVIVPQLEAQLKEYQRQPSHLTKSPMLVKVSWPPGSVSYPANLSGLYSTASQKPQTHFESCPHLPQEERNHLARLIRESRSTQLPSSAGDGDDDDDDNYVETSGGNKRRRMHQGISALMYYAINCQRIGIRETTNGLRFGRDLSLEPLSFQTTRIKVEREMPHLVPKQSFSAPKRSSSAGASSGTGRSRNTAPDRSASLSSDIAPGAIANNPKYRELLEQALKETKEIEEGDDVTKKKTLLARSTDRQLVTDFMFLAITQMAICHANQHDFLTRGKKTRLMRLGFAGFCCKHCLAQQRENPKLINLYSCRSFSSAPDNLASAISNSFVGHLLKCPYIPLSIQHALSALKQIHTRQMQQFPYGSQRKMFVALWQRMRAADQIDEKDQVGLPLLQPPSKPAQTAAAVPPLAAAAGTADPINADTIPTTTTTTTTTAAQRVVHTPHIGKKRLRKIDDDDDDDDDDGNNNKKKVINIDNDDDEVDGDDDYVNDGDDDEDYDDNWLPGSSKKQPRKKRRRRSAPVGPPRAPIVQRQQIPPVEPSAVVSSAEARGAQFPVSADEETQRILKESEEKWDPAENDHLFGREDRYLVTDYVFLTMRQLKVAHPTPEDFRGNRRNNVMGRIAGMCCIHCDSAPGGAAPSGRSFPSAPDNMASALNSSLYNHMQRCPYVPIPMKRAFQHLRKIHSSQCSNMAFGSQRRFFNKVYNKLKVIPIKKITMPITPSPAMKSMTTAHATGSSSGRSRGRTPRGARSSSLPVNDDTLAEYGFAKGGGYFHCLHCRMVPFEFRTPGSILFVYPTLANIMEHSEACQKDGIYLGLIIEARKILERDYILTGSEKPLSSQDSFRTLIQSVVGDDEQLIELFTTLDPSKLSAPSSSSSSVVTSCLWHNLPRQIDFDKVQTSFESMANDLNILHSKSLYDHPKWIRYLQMISPHLQIPKKRPEPKQIVVDKESAVATVPEPAPAVPAKTKTVPTSDVSKPKATASVIDMVETASPALTTVPTEPKINKGNAVVDVEEVSERSAGAATDVAATNGLIDKDDNTLNGNDNKETGSPEVPTKNKPQHESSQICTEAATAGAASKDDMMDTSDAGVVAPTVTATTTTTTAEVSATTTTTNEASASSIDHPTDDKMEEEKREVSPKNNDDDRDTPNKQSVTMDGTTGIGQGNETSEKAAVAYDQSVAFVDPTIRDNDDPIADAKQGPAASIENDNGNQNLKSDDNFNYSHNNTWTELTTLMDDDGNINPNAEVSPQLDHALILAQLRDGPVALSPNNQKQPMDPSQQQPDDNNNNYFFTPKDPTDDRTDGDFL